MKPTKVYAVYGDFGNIGHGSLLGISLDKSEATMMANGRGSLDCGGHGRVCEVMAISTEDGWYVLQNEEPLRLGEMAPCPYSKCCSYDVWLIKPDPIRVISAIKVVRELTGMFLKDAKRLVDSSPVVVKKSVPEEDGMEMKRRLEATGATVELRECMP